MGYAEWIKRECDPTEDRRSAEQRHTAAFRRGGNKERGHHQQRQRRDDHPPTVEGVGQAPKRPLQQHAAGDQDAHEQRGALRLEACRLACDDGP